MEFINTQSYQWSHELQPEFMQACVDHLSKDFWPSYPTLACQARIEDLFGTPVILIELGCTWSAC